MSGDAAFCTRGAKWLASEKKKKKKPIKMQFICEREALATVATMSTVVAFTRINSI